MNEHNALALEYQLQYRSARGDLDVSNLVNNPSANGRCSVQSFSFPEHRRDAPKRVYSSPECLLAQILTFTADRA
jgi:hypothetical protein